MSVGKGSRGEERARPTSFTTWDPACFPGMLRSNKNSGRRPTRCAQYTGVGGCGGVFPFRAGPCNLLTAPNVNLYTELKRSL